MYELIHKSSILLSSVRRSFRVRGAVWAVRGVGVGCLLLATLSAFNSGAASVKACSPETVAKATTGYMCTVNTQGGPVQWRVEAVLATGGRSLRVVKDLKSGLLVSDDLGKHSQDSTIKQDLCNSPEYASNKGNLTTVKWRVPSGYPRRLNGMDGFPSHDSDFMMLEVDGLREVVPGLANKFFISSSDFDGGGSYTSWGYDGEFGGLGPGCNGNGNVSLRCVGQ
jgi:hypothetical protein